MLWRLSLDTIVLSDKVLVFIYVDICAVYLFLKLLLLYLQLLYLFLNVVKPDPVFVGLLSDLALLLLQIFNLFLFRVHGVGELFYDSTISIWQAQ